MEIYFRLWLSMLCPLVLGYYLLSLILGKQIGLGIFEKLGLGFALGVGGLAWLMFAVSFLGINFQVFYFILITLMALILVLAAKNIPGVLRNFPVGWRSNLILSQKIIIPLIGLIYIYLLFSWFNLPLAKWDSWAIYGFKAKALYLAKTVPVGFFTDSTKAYAHLDYPLLLPLAQAWVFTALGSWNDQLVNIISVFYSLSLIFIFYFTLKAFSNRRYAIFFTLFLMTIPKLTEFLFSGYADVPLMVGYFINLAYLLRWFYAPQKNGFLYLSAIALGLAVWSKNDGLAICLVNFIIFIYLVFRRWKFSRNPVFLIIRYLALIAVIILPWMLFKTLLHIPNDLINAQNVSLGAWQSNLNRLPLIFQSFAGYMASLKGWNFLWVALPVLIVLRFKKAFSLPALAVLISLLAYFGIWVIIYMITPREINWHLANSAERLLLQMAPLALFLTALLVCPVNKNEA